MCDTVAELEKRWLTEAECEAIGGHCYEMEPYVLALNPPVSVRTCKHCGKRQYGREQPSMRWE